MIRIRATEDGSYVLCRDETVLVTGLTRDQAQAIAQACVPSCPVKSTRKKPAAANRAG
jgi:hypothetical protein